MAESHSAARPPYAAAIPVRSRLDRSAKTRARRAAWAGSDRVSGDDASADEIRKPQVGAVVGVPPNWPHASSWRGGDSAAAGETVSGSAAGGRRPPRGRERPQVSPDGGTA